MEVSGAMGYFSMLSMQWFFAACSLIGFGWCVLLFMQKGKKRQTKKMDKAELLKAIKEMMDANQARLEAKIEANQAKTNAKLKEMSEEILSIRSELEENIQHRIENVMTRVNHLTRSLQKEMTERIEKTQVDLQAMQSVAVSAGSAVSAVSVMRVGVVQCSRSCR
jgi:uncharacterized secreted protein with C-terminal beta-propeller domain